MGSSGARVMGGRTTRRPQRRRRPVPIAPVLALALIALGGLWYTASRDRTRGMRPEQIVQAAGRALLQAPGYRFSSELTGEAVTGPFPNAVMRGEYRREPPLLHLSGEASSGARRVPLEYYLEGTALYVRSPESGEWMLVEQPDGDQLYAFQPRSLATTLLSSVRSAELVGRERLAGGEAVVLKLALSPRAQRLLTPQWGETADCRLWVYTRTLKPARFAIAASGEGAKGRGRPATVFRYQIDWEYGRQAPLAVPAQVKAEALR